MDPLLIGVMIVLLAAAAATVAIIRRRRRPRPDGPSPVPMPEGSLVGTSLGGYTLVEKLGGGGMGAVYRGEPLDGDGPPVAVKVLKRELGVNPLFQSRFEREALVGADLRHPSLVRVHSCSREGDTMFLVQDLVTGDPLRKHIRPDLPVAEAIGLLRQMIDAIQHAHAAGCVHRDLKPGNVMVTPQGRVRIYDFGLARREDLARLTKTGQFLGTMGYCAPELLDGRQADARSDQYALGVIAYELLTGRNPFRGNMSGMVGGVEPPPLSEARSDVPRALSDVVRRMMAMDPRDRYEDLQAALFALDHLAEGEPETTTGQVATSAIPDLPEPETTFDALDATPVARPQGPVPCLLVMTGTGAGRVHRLQRSKVTVGRSQGADIGLDETGVSRLHVELTRLEAGGWQLTDLSSRNGTFVEEERVTSRLLQDGDRIRLGANVVLKFVLQDPTQAQLQTHLYEKATRDPLTGAANRNFFLSAYQGALAYSAQQQTTLSVMMLDIDHFKRVNDTYGHHAGDAVLREVVTRLAAQMRREDILSRFGGEEFVVLARMDGDAAAGLAERFRAAVEAAPFPVGEGDEATQIPVTVSIGVACLTGSVDVAPDTGDALLRAADAALYRAKSSGRNQVQLAWTTP